MARRTFRYSKELDRMVEVVQDVPTDIDAPGVQGDIQPFMHNGNLIKSRSHLRDYMGQHNLVPIEAAGKYRPTQAEQQRERQAFREQLWEGVSRTFSMGNRPRDRRS